MTAARMVALMAALSAMSYFDRTIMSIAGPTIMRELRISDVAMGSVYSIFILTYTILMIPGGALADRFGPRLILMLSGIGNAVLTGLTGACSRLTGFYVIRLILGGTTAPLYPACARMTRYWIPPAGLGRAQAVIQGSAAFGSAASPVLFAFLISAVGWRASFWCAALATALLYAVWWTVARDRPPHRGAVAHKPAEPDAATFGTLLRDPDMILLTLSYFCLNYFEYIFFYWIYYYFGEIRHLGSSQSGIYVSILMLTMGVMTPLGGWASDWLVLRFGLKAGRRVVPFIGMPLSALLLIAGASGWGTAVTVTLLSLAFGFSASAEGPFWATAINIGGRHSGAACGIMNTGGNTGGMLAPVLTPLLAHRFGWAGGLYFGSLVVLVGVVGWFFIDADACVTSPSTPEPATRPA
jgi:MFS family permease